MLGVKLIANNPEGEESGLRSFYDKNHIYNFYNYMASLFACVRKLDWPENMLFLSLQQLKKGFKLRLFPFKSDLKQTIFFLIYDLLRP